MLYITPIAQHYLRVSSKIQKQIIVDSRQAQKMSDWQIKVEEWLFSTILAAF